MAQTIPSTKQIFSRIPSTKQGIHYKRQHTGVWPILKTFVQKREHYSPV